MWTFIFILLLAFIVVSLLGKSEVVGNWSHLYEGMNHDPDEFYNLVIETLEERQVPGDVIASKKTFKEGGMLSHQRLYLEISRGDYTYHICAAPWGTGFFFSWWLRKAANQNFLERIPGIGPQIAEANKYDTYYKLDTDGMFRASVQQSVQTAIDKLTNAKGVKGLTELERKPELRSMLK